MLVKEIVLLNYGPECSLNSNYNFKNFDKNQTYFQDIFNIPTLVKYDQKWPKIM